MSKKVIVIILTIFSCTVIISDLIIKPFSRPLDASQLAEEGDLRTLKAIDTIYCDEFEGTDFTCTGIAYDENDKSFWIGDYGAMSPKDKPFPRLLEVSENFEDIKRIITLSDQFPYDINLQGVAYDAEDDSLWITTGNSVANISKNGDVYDEIYLGEYRDCQSNGVCYDKRNDSLWVLCYRKYLLNYAKNGDLLKKINVDLRDQDQIMMADTIIYATVGADYTGSSNYLATISTDLEKIKVPYRLAGSFAVEGICANNGKLYVVNDGLYHDAKNKRSYINIYAWDGNMPIDDD